MGLEVDPDFATTGRFYTCQGATTGPDEHDVRVTAWTLDDQDEVGDPQVLVSGFPTSSGRHGGCRLLVATDGSLYVGTGDAAQGTNPQDLTSLGGKVLRLDRTTGAPWPDNPFADAADSDQRYVQSYGHRNVQGLAERADGTVWDVEHGSFRDDEVNQLVAGGDYGWNPVPEDGGEGYNEEVPMTDQDLPGDQVDAAWSSGDPTIAPGGATFVSGEQWGDLDGDLAMAVLKDQEVLFLSFAADGTLETTRAPEELQQLGRVRTVVTDTSPEHAGDLLVTTDNGGGDDALYRVRPAS
jgi:glucose/arabinose dehydrogenase